MADGPLLAHAPKPAAAARRPESAATLRLRMGARIVQAHQAKVAARKLVLVRRFVLKRSVVCGH